MIIETECEYLVMRKRNQIYVHISPVYCTTCMIWYQPYRWTPSQDTFFLHSVMRQRTSFLVTLERRLLMKKTLSFRQLKFLIIVCMPFHIQQHLIKHISYKLLCNRVISFACITYSNVMIYVNYILLISEWVDCRVEYNVQYIFSWELSWIVHFSWYIV